MPLAYADDVDIIGRSISEVVAAFSKFAEEAPSIGLAVNGCKTKLLLSIAKDTSIGVFVDIDGYNFELLKDFVYLGFRTNTDRCYFGLRKQLCERALSCITKICLYNSPILPVLLNGAEIWTITSSDEQARCGGRLSSLTC